MYGIKVELDFEKKLTFLGTLLNACGYYCKTHDKM